MNLLRLAGLAVCLAVAPVTAEEREGSAFTPDRYEIERYGHIWERSPFVIETKVVEESAGLAERFALTGIAEIGGSPVVFLLDRASLSRVAVGGGRPHQGLEIVSIDQHPNPKDSSVVIRMGAEQASLRFDSETLARTVDPAHQVHVQPTVALPPGARPPPNAQAMIPGQPMPPGFDPNNPAHVQMMMQQQGMPPGAAPPARVIRRTLVRTRE